MKRNKKLALCGAAIVVALGANKVANVWSDISKRDREWGERQKICLVEGMSKVHPGSDYFDIQRELYEGAANCRPVGEDVVRKVGDLFNVPESDARDFSHAYQNLYGFMIANYSEGDFDANSQDQLNDLQSKVVKVHEKIGDEKDIRQTLMKEGVLYTIRGDRLRDLSPVKVKDYTFERPGYKFIMESEAKKLKFFGIPLKVRNKNFDVGMFARDADKNGDKTVTVEETFDEFLKRLLPGLRMSDL